MTAGSRGCIGRVRGVAVAAVLLPAAMACYTYQTVPPDALEPSTSVRVRYDPAQDVAITARNSATLPQVSEFSGRVVERRADSIAVRIEGAVRSEGRRQQVAPGSVITVPIDTTAVRALRFSAGRTSLGVLGGLGVTAFALFLACGEFCR